MKKAILISVVLWLILIPALLVGWIKQPFVEKVSLNSNVVINADNLKKNVEFLSENFATRNFNDVPTLSSASEYIFAKLSQTTTRTHLQTYSVDSEKFSNVIARFGPEEGELVIIGAHYDTHENTMGADDNASGVAGLLELARIFAKNPPTIPVELVAYTLEEPPIFRTEDMGSQRHAANLNAEKITPKLVLVLEMIGYFSETSNSQSYPIAGLDWIYPTTGNYIAVVGNFVSAKQTRLVKAAMTAASSLPVESINAPTFLTGIDFSDHASYWLYDIPAVMITDTSFYRNANYHQATDTADTLDYTRMAQVVQAVYGVVKHLESKGAH